MYPLLLVHERLQASKTLLIHWSIQQNNFPNSKIKYTTLKERDRERKKNASTLKQDPEIHYLITSLAEELKVSVQCVSVEPKW